MLGCCLQRCPNKNPTLVQHPVLTGIRPVSDHWDTTLVGKRTTFSNFTCKYGDQGWVCWEWPGLTVSWTEGKHLTRRNVYRWWIGLHPFIGSTLLSQTFHQLTLTSKVIFTSTAVSRRFISHSKNKIWRRNEIEGNSTLEYVLIQTVHLWVFWNHFKLWVPLVSMLSTHIFQGCKG